MGNGGDAPGRENEEPESQPERTTAPQSEVPTFRWQEQDRPEPAPELRLSPEDASAAWNARLAEAPGRDRAPSVETVRSLADMPKDLHGQVRHLELPGGTLVTIDGRGADPATDRLEVRGTCLLGRDNLAVRHLQIEHTEGFRVDVAEAAGVSIDVHRTGPFDLPSAPRGATPIRIGPEAAAKLGLPAARPAAAGDVPLAVAAAPMEIRSESNRAATLAVPGTDGVERRIVLAADRTLPDGRPPFVYRFATPSGPQGEARVEIVAEPGVSIRYEGFPTVETAGGRLQWITDPEVAVARVQKGSLPGRGQTVELGGQATTSEYCRYGPQMSGGEQPVVAVAPDVTVTSRAGSTDIRHLESGLTVRVSVPELSGKAAFAYDVGVPSGPSGHDSITLVKTPEADVRILGCRVDQVVVDPEIRVYEVADVAAVPAQGTPLTSDTLARLEARELTTVPATCDYAPGQVLRMGLTDMAIGTVPVLGDLVDIGEFIYGVATGQDRWGRPLTRQDIAVLGMGAVIGLVPGLSGATVRQALNVTDDVARALSKADRDFIRACDTAIKRGQALPAADTARLREILGPLEGAEHVAEVTERGSVAGRAAVSGERGSLGAAAEQTYITRLKEQFARLEDLDIRPVARPSAGRHTYQREPSEVLGRPEYRTEVTGAPEHAFEERMQTSQGRYSYAVYSEGRRVLELDGISPEGWIDEIKIGQSMDRVDDIVTQLRRQADFAETYGLRGVRYSISPPEVAEEVERRIADERLRNTFRAE